MGKKNISTTNAPQAIGPYSQAVEAGSWLFVSGQIALDPATGELVSGDIQDQTKRVMENIKGILKAADSNLNAIVKCTIYLKNIEDFAVVNKIYGNYFQESKPARATVEVSGLPKDAQIEIDAVAYLGD